nr:hypothetical protein [Tanacetum cinerariifolium]
MNHYTMKSLWIYWIRGDDEVELTDEESSDNEDDVAEVFRIDINIFDFETPMCKAFKEFNYLLQIDPDLLTKDIEGFKTYKEYKDDWIYEWNRDVPWVDNHRLILEFGLNPHQWKSHEITYHDYDEIEYENETHDERQKLCETHELPMCNMRRFEMIKYSFGQDKGYVAVKEDEYNDLARTSDDACRAYQEIFRMMDEGCMTDTIVIPTKILIIAPTIPPSPDYTPASLNYSPASDTESDPSEDPSSYHIPPLLAISPFLSSADDIIDSDTPDTPPSPAHDHSSPDLPSTSAGPSRKRRRFLMTFVPALPHVFGALSPVRANLIPSPKRVRDFGYLANVEVDPRETSLRDDVMVRDALRDRGIDARIIVEAVDREESETGTRGLVEVIVERVTHLVMLEDTHEPAQEKRAVECMYETLRSLVQRFHDHTEAIPVHRIHVIEGVQREQGHRIVRVESAVTVLTMRIAELERDNRRLRDTASVESQRVDRLQRDMSCMQRELRHMRRFQFYDRVRVGRFEACARKHMGYRISPSVTLLCGRKMPNTRSGASMTHEEVKELVALRVAEEMEAREAAMNLEPLNENGDEQEGENEGNGNGGNGGNKNGRNRDGGNGKNGNGGNGDGGNGENGNGNMNRNHGMNYRGFMLVARELYCPRNEIQKMETELWNPTVKGNDLTAYTQRFQELILLCTRMAPDEEDRVERFIGGLPDNIQGNGYGARSAENKRRIESNPRDNHGQQLPFKRYHHVGPCTVRCGNCKKAGHLTRDCTETVAPNTQRAPVGNQQGIVCYECGRPGHFRKDYPKLRNHNRGNQTRNRDGNKTGNQTGGNEATARAYAIGGGGTNPNSNVVLITPPTTQTDTIVIPTKILIIAPTIPPSPDYTPASLNYSPASDTESDPSEDPSSYHIPPLLAISPFLSSADDIIDSDTPDTPPSPAHGTPFTEITSFTKRSPVIPRRRVMILAHGQHIPHGRPYHYHPNEPVHMMTARKRVEPLPV